MTQLGGMGSYLGSCVGRATLPSSGRVPRVALRCRRSNSSCRARFCVTEEAESWWREM